MNHFILQKGAINDNKKAFIAYKIKKMTHLSRALKTNKIYKKWQRNLLFFLCGEIRYIPYIAAFMTIDPNITYCNTLDGSLIDFHYKADYELPFKNWFDLEKLDTFLKSLH